MNTCNHNELKLVRTIVKSLDHDSSYVNCWFHLYVVRTAWYLLIGKEDICSVGSDCCGFKLDAERVVLVVDCLHRHVEATLIGQRDRYIACTGKLQNLYSASKLMELMDH